MFYNIYHWFVQKIPLVVWNKNNSVNEEQKLQFAHLLANDYYVILTGDNGTLSSWIVSFFTWIETGTWSKYSHAVMNCDFISDPNRRDEFKFMEATAKGVHYSTFDEIFACDYVCMLSPKNMSVEKWTAVIDGLIMHNGKPYDDLFDLADSTKINCVELVINAFKELPDYQNDFVNLDEHLNRGYQVLPQTFIDCGDLVIRYEIDNDYQKEQISLHE